MQDIRELKNSMRNSVKEYRAGLDPEQKLRMDRAVLERITALDEYKTAKTILTYVSVAIEVDTLSLIERALADGKKVACPRCVPGTRTMEFYLIDNISQLYPGAFSVPEPQPDKERLVSDFDGCICIVPGLSFDYSGYRLGYGKGYYDRFLSGFEGRSIGLCYGECVCRRLPHGRYDRAVDVLVTELFIKKN